jgi:prepilin-type N-terminal cleavage/methylation domain-containing protein
MKKKGFTLIELLVVISIISMLTSVVLASLNDARAKARDIRRIQDLNQIRNAFFLYYDQTGNWMEAGSGCGNAGNGMYWFNYTYGIYKSMAQCLIDSGVMKQEIIDPSGLRSGTTPTQRAYIKETCIQGGQKVTYLYANLETKPYSTTATDTTCDGSIDAANGMNYFIKF